MKYALVAIILLSGCASAYFKEELLTDGKTWRVFSPPVKCSLYHQEVCHDQLTTDMGKHAVELCASQDYRLFSCKIKDRPFLNTLALKQTCLLTCEDQSRPKKSQPLGAAD